MRAGARWSDCKSKRFFPTDLAAQGVIKRARRNPRGKKIPIRAYECPWCEGYHLTSQEARS